MFLRITSRLSRRLLRLRSNPSLEAAAALCGHANTISCLHGTRTTAYTGDWDGHVFMWNIDGMLDSEQNGGATKVGKILQAEIFQADNGCQIFVLSLADVLGGLSGAEGDVSERDESSWKRMSWTTAPVLVPEMEWVPIFSCTRFEHSESPDEDRSTLAAGFRAP